MRWRLFQNFLIQKPLLRKVATLVGGTAIAQCLTIAAAPVLSRLYTPEDFGSLAVYTSLLTLLGLAASWRYELAITLPSEEEEARAVVGVAFSVLTASVLVLTLTLTVIHLIQVPAFFSWISPLWPYRWLLPLGVFGLGVCQILKAWALRKQAYGVIAKTRMRQSIGGIITGIVGGWFSSGAWGLIVGQMMQQTLGGFRLGRFFSGTNSFWKAASFGSEKWWEALRKYFRFASLSTGAGLLNLSSVALPPLLFASFYDSGTTGSFNFAFRIVSLPMMLIGTAMSQVFLGEIAARDREGNDDAAFLFRKVTRHMSLPALALALSGFIAPWAFPLIFGTEWRQAGVFATFLAFSCAAQLIVSPISSVAILRQRQGLQLALDALRAVFVTASICVAGARGWSAETAALLYAVFMIILYCLYFFAYQKIAFHPDG